MAYSNLSTAAVDLVAQVQMGEHKLLRSRSQRGSTSSLSSSLKFSESGRMNFMRTDGQIKYINSVDCSSVTMCTKFNDEGSMFAVGLANGIIKVYKTEGACCLYTLTDEDIMRDCLPCTSLNFVFPTDDLESSTQSYLLVTYASGQIKMWHTSTGRCLYTLYSDQMKQVLCSSLHPINDQVAAGGSDCKIDVYDLETKKIVVSHKASDVRELMNGHRLRILAVQYHPAEANMLISGGWDDTVQIWDSRQQHAVRRIYGPHICGDALDIDPIHNHLMTGSWRKGNELQIWDVSNEAKLKDIPQDAFNKCMLYCCQWLGQQHILCGGSDQNMIRIIDRGTLNPMKSFDHYYMNDDLCDFHFHSASWQKQKVVSNHPSKDPSACEKYKAPSIPLRLTTLCPHIY